MKMPEFKRRQTTGSKHLARVLEEIAKVCEKHGVVLGKHYYDHESACVALRTQGGRSWIQFDRIDETGVVRYDPFDDTVTEPYTERTYCACCGVELCADSSAYSSLSDDEADNPVYEGFRCFKCDRKAWCAWAKREDA